MYKKCVLIAASAAMALTASAQERTTVMRPVYGANIVRIMPLTVFNDGVGLGLSYERILDKDGKVGVNIPVSLGIRNNSYNGSTGSYDQRMNYTVLVNPGIKFYPSGQRKVTYAIGASLFAAMGTDDSYRIDNLGIYHYTEGSFLKTGIMVNNYLQFNLSPKINIGLELGIGPMYLNQYKDNNTNTTTNYGIDVMGQFSFHIGYRF
ncbi:hypothetical protein DBR32_10925 [Taibaiella sp. KBW10]|uniref:hypothetical protein n=1 Tax=Taibaiella sp. KBW10 TaxID=2153357 RepID=UPI000F5B131E|nr:hypothetical protein [Taibaiella sp. KBW10]RQO30092.1 hypothetical protein DBR32_10925 [Taibaiella sp. KBW10]